MASITITNAGLNLIRDAMQGQNSSLITWVALGTSNTAPTTSDTVLGNEVFRKKVTTYASGVNPGEVVISMYLGASDANGVDVEEVAFFGGNSATSAPNTGVMLARGLYSHNPKVSTESISFQLDLTI